MMIRKLNSRNFSTNTNDLCSTRSIRCKGFWINSIQVFSGFTYIVFYEKTRHLITNYTNISDTKAKAFLSGGISSALNQTLVIPFDVISQHIMVALNNRRKQGQSEGSIGLSSAKAKTSAGGGGFKSTYFKSLSLNPEEVQRKGIAIAIIQQLFREGGLRSFYKGYLATLICFVPSTACWWMLYHNCNEFLFSSNLTQNVPYMFVNCLSGTISGATVSIMTNPLDLLRANIQVHRPSSYVSAVKYLWKEDKWRIFSKGLTVRLTHSSLSSALIVIGYETMKRFSVDEKYRDQVRW